MIEKLNDYPFYLGAGEERLLEVAGDFYHILEATDTVYISLDDDEFNKRGKGLGENGPFYRIRVKSDVAQGIRIVAGFGQLNDTRDNVSVTVSATVTPSNNTLAIPDITVPAGTTVQLVAARAGRKSLMLKSLFTNDPSDSVRLGDLASVGAGSGIQMVSGEGVTIETETAYYAYNEGSNDFVISATEHFIS